MELLFVAYMYSNTHVSNKLNVAPSSTKIIKVYIEETVHSSIFFLYK